MWDGVFPDLEILDIPEASKRALIEDAPSDFEGVEKIIHEINGIEYDERKPFFYQRDAIDCWFKNGKKGILEMASRYWKAREMAILYKSRRCEG